MKELKTVLVVIESDEVRQHALDKATALARFVDCEIHLMIADYSAFYEDGNFYDPLQAKQLRLEHAQAQMLKLESLAQPLREEGLRISVSTSWGNPAYKEILRRSDEIDASLVIKATRKHSKLARFFMANEDWELVRYCEAPLLLVKDQQWHSSPGFVAAIDPNHLKDKPAALDNKIINVAQTLAQASAGEAHLFHSIWKPQMANLYPFDADRDRGEDALRQLARQFGIDDSHCHCPEENIVDSLPAVVAQCNASVVVMGAISRSRLDQVLIGNTAEKVLDELDCDVLIVKPDS